MPAGGNTLANSLKIDFDVIGANVSHFDTIAATSRVANYREMHLPRQSCLNAE